MLRLSCVVLILVGCGKSEKSDSATSESTPAQKGETKRAEPTVDLKKERLCRRIDTDAIAKAIELPAGLSRTGSGTIIKGGREPTSLVCSYYEKGRNDAAMSFHFSIKATTELEKRDFLGRFEWKPFDGLGQEARIGRDKKGVHVQTVAKGVLLQVDVEHHELAIDDLERRAVAATKAMIEQLPADAAAELN